MRSRFLLLAILILVLAGPLSAVDSPELFTVRVPVADRTEADWYDGVRRALREVLIQVTGDPRAVDGPQLAPLLENSTDFMQESAFVPAPGSASGYGLMVRFDPQRIGRALDAVGPLPQQRELPATLVWLAVEAGSGYRLVAADSDPRLRQALDAAAQSRSAALLYPLLDLDDRRAVSAAEVWQGDGAGVRQASARYGAPSVLIGRLRRADGGAWSVQWTHLLRGAATATETRGTTPEAALEAGVAWMAGRLAGGAAAPRPGRAGSGSILVVEQVASLEDYARVSRYLAGIELLQGAELLQVEPERLLFQIRPRASHAALVQALSADGMLAPVGAGGIGEDGALHFRLLP